jgi:hypothetical protein
VRDTASTRNGRISERGRKATGTGSCFGDKALVVHEEEAKVLALIKARRDEGMSLRAIVLELEAAGVASKRGARWHPTTVARLLGG